MRAIVIDRWREAWQESTFRLQLPLTMVVLVLVLFAFAQFLVWVEGREGVPINDPILAIVEAQDFTWMTFGMIYLSVIGAIAYLAQHPWRLLVAMQAYILIVVMRAGMMYVTPLSPSDGLIVLRDPFVQFAGDGTAPTKDLFFSGHTSTLFLLSLVVQHPQLKRLFLCCTVLVAVFVVWQHVHYVVDVVVAPFVAYGCYRITETTHERRKEGSSRKIPYAS